MLCSKKGRQKAKDQSPVLAVASLQIFFSPLLTYYVLFCAVSLCRFDHPDRSRLFFFMSEPPARGALGKIVVKSPNFTPDLLRLTFRGSSTCRCLLYSYEAVFQVLNTNINISIFLQPFFSTCLTLVLPYWGNTFFLPMNQ